MQSLLAKLRNSARAKLKAHSQVSLASSPVPAKVPSRSSVPASQFPVVHFVPDEKSDTEPELAYLSLSSDLRLLPVRRNEDPPASLLCFRRSKNPFKLRRMKDIPDGIDPSHTPLEQIVAARVAPVVHRHGPALLISEGDRNIQIVAVDEEERDLWLSSLSLRLAPMSFLRHLFKAEIRSVRSASKDGGSVAAAARDMVRLDAASGNCSGDEESRCASLARRLWMTLSSSAQSLNWTSTFGQAIAGCAEDVEKLAKPFCQIGVMGCVFSLISLSARTAHLLAAERDGREKLDAARKTMHDASLSLCEWLVHILRTGFQDDDLIELVFDVLEECWDAAARVEEYVLRKWMSRVWKADDVKDIEENVAVVRKQLLAVGILKILSTELEEVKKRVDVLEADRDVADEFRPFFPDPVRFTAGLLSEASKTTIDHLKLVILPKPVPRGTFNVKSEEKRVARVALTSVSGEGGVGKTSVCKLLCADSEVQSHFASGAIVWIALGPGVSEEKVKEKISSIVTDCGGRRTSETIRRAVTFNAAIDYARQFFEGHRILLVIDNVWKPIMGSDVSNWMTALSRIVSFRGSVVLMTTRFRDLCLSRDVEHVCLGRLNLDDENSPDWKIAEALYDEHVKDGGTESHRKEQSQEYRITRTKALKISCGLPLAIASICGLVRLRGNSAEAILSLLARTEKDGGLAGRSVGKQTASVVGHIGLYAAMSESLEFLDESERGDDMFSGYRYGDGKCEEQLSETYMQFGSMPVSARYAALEAMDRSSGKCSFFILARLWHLRSADEAEELSLLFANVGLGRIERSAQSDEEDTFVLHDLQYDFCCGAAHRFSVNGHLLLLSACTPWLGKERDWASYCFSSDKNDSLGSQLEAPTHSLRLYMGRSLFRHLSQGSVMAGESKAAAIAKVMVDLLTDFRWLRGRGAVHGRVAVVLDFRMCLSACAFNMSFSFRKYPLISTECRESISLIYRVVELTPEAAYWSIPTGIKSKVDAQSTERCLQGVCDCELAMHVVGRLHQALIDGWDAEVDVFYVEKLMRSTEENVREGWLWARNGCFPHLPNDKRLLNAITVGRGESSVRCVAALGDGTHVLSAYSGMVRIHNISTSETVLSFGSGVISVAARETSRKDSYVVISGGRGVCVTKVRREVDGSFREVDSFILDSRGVANISVSRNGSRVVSVCSEEPFDVSVWTHTSGDSEIWYTKSGSFPCHRSISNLTISPKGDLIVSSEGSQVLFWPKDPTSFWSRSDYNSIPGDIISSIVFSEDGKALFVGRWHGSMEVWSVLSKCCTKRVEIRGGYMNCAAFLSGSFCEENRGSVADLLVIGTRNSVQVYNFNELSLLEECPLSTSAHSVCTSRNLIIAGCANGSLSIVDVKDVSEIPLRYSVKNNNQEGNGSPVECVAFALKQGVILSGHTNGTLRTWDFESGKLVCSLTGRHSRNVTCIDVSDDEELAVSGSWDGSLRVWDVASWKFLYALQESEAIVYANIISDNRRIVSCTRMGSVTVWSGANRGLEFCLFSPDGRLSGNRENLSHVAGRGTSLLEKLCRTGRYLSHVAVLSRASRFTHLVPWESLFSQMATSEEADTARLKYDLHSDKMEKTILMEANAWEISKQWKTIWCSQISANGTVSARHAITFTRRIDDIVMSPKPSASHADSLVIALALYGQDSPAILHLLPVCDKRQQGNIL